MNGRFTADTAERTDRSDRSIQRDAERGEKISKRLILNQVLSPL